MPSIGDGLIGLAPDEDLLATFDHAEASGSPSWLRSTVRGTRPTR
jgi:hypothetical protein